MTAQPDDEGALDQAIAWQQALARDDADWDGYIAWLEIDPRHRRLFDEIALLDRTVDERVADLRALVVPVGRQDDAAGTEPRGRWRWWLGGAVAAGIAVAVAVPGLMSAPGDREFATAPGQTRRLVLADGETVDLAPSSRLILAHGDPRSLELAQGDAYFDIRHDPRRVLNVRAGGLAVTDVGTKFGVGLAAQKVTVAVAEGHVSVAAGGGRKHVMAGQSVVADGGVIGRTRPVVAGDVGSWRSGRLVYDQAPLRVVASDLARYLEKKVTVDPAIREQRFSGVLSIGDGSRLFRNLSDLMAISYRVQGNSVRLMPVPVPVPAR